MVTPQVLDKIRNEIILSERDTRYKLEAYSFILRGLNFYHTKSGERRHFTGQELAKGLVEFAQKQFGPITYSVLRNWGVTKTDDLGNIVYNLIIVCQEFSNGRMLIPEARCNDMGTVGDLQGLACNVDGDSPLMFSEVS